MRVKLAERRRKIQESNPPDMRVARGQRRQRVIAFGYKQKWPPLKGTATLVSGNFLEPGLTHQEAPRHTKRAEGRAEQHYRGAAIRQTSRWCPPCEERPAGKAVAIPIGIDVDGSTQVTDVPNDGSLVWTIVFRKQICICAYCAKVYACITGAVMTKYGTWQRPAKSRGAMYERVILSASGKREPVRMALVVFENQVVHVLRSVRITGRYAVKDVAKRLAVADGEGTGVIVKCKHQCANGCTDEGEFCRN